MVCGGRWLLFGWFVAVGGCCLNGLWWFVVVVLRLISVVM